MSVSRRLFLQQAVSVVTIGHGGAASAMRSFLQPGKQSTVPATAIRDAIAFGVGPDRRPLDARSFYRVPSVPSPQDRLCFDVSNNRIACSVNQRGLLERFAIQLGVAPIETRTSPVGAYVEKILLRCGPMPWMISVGETKPIALHELGQPEVHLQDGLFPRFEWTIDQVRVKMLVFAPQTEASRPRAIFVNFTVASSQKQVGVQLQIDPLALRESDATIGRPRVMLLVGSEGGWSQSGASPVAVDRGDTTYAFLMETTKNELERTHQELVALPVSIWLDKTREYHLARYGQIDIPQDPFFAELYVRASELSRQSLMLDGAGRFGGSFNGSDLPAAANVWMRDCFYSTLPQGFLCPELARSAISFFLDRGIPSHPLGEHADRFPGAKGVTNSLGNSLAGIVLAGMYYQNNNDSKFFLDRPELLKQSIAILNQVLESRREDVFLFPSIYVSDGESRGDFHTGSNIFLWRALLSVVRLADEVYGQAEEAALWRTYADRLREAIVANCIVVEDGKPRFVEGAMQDHTKIGGHDGEESDVTLAAFYDFCAVDSPEYLGAAREGIDPANPYAIPELEGIWWYAHAKWSSATFPGWTTALAGAQNEGETLRHLERIRTLTDADGSFWWWPYPHEAKVHPEHPLRTNSKCGWAAGVYLCLFTKHLFGISVDAPKRTLAFRPWTPWNEFTWNRCRIGSTECDYSYRRIGHEIVLSVRNRTGHSLQMSLRAVLPESSKLLHASVSIDAAAQVTQARAYGRVSAECSVEVKTGEQVRLTLEFTAI